MKVALQVFAYDEPGLYDTLDEYADQPAPDWADIEYQACVTPADRGVVSGMVSEMVEHAIDHPVFEYVETPKGILSSRNLAHDMAVGAGADVIVSADADAPPLEDDALRKILDPIASGEAVGSHCDPMSPITPVGVVVNVFGAVEDAIIPHFNGYLHAFTADAWHHAGPFDDSIDQTSVRLVRAEEEFGFYRRVREVGPIARTDARVLNDTRRMECRLRLRNDEFCQRRGAETFNPR